MNCPCLIHTTIHTVISMNYVIYPEAVPSVPIGEEIEKYRIANVLEEMKKAKGKH